MKWVFSVVYNSLLFVGLLFLLPRILYRKKGSILRQRLFACPPDPQGRKVFWIHAVSVGEVKSAKGLLQRIKHDAPDRFVLVTTCTSTGLDEAKRSLPTADALAYLPLDFSWRVCKWVSRLKPELLLFIEGDLWPHLVQAVKQCGGKVALVSGKISERSATRWSKISPIAKKLFAPLDLLLVQNELYYERFKPYVHAKQTLHIGGNLKFDAAPQLVDRARFAPLFENISFGISLVSTHAPEEIELLDALESTHATLFLAPRHPERFAEVASLLEQKKISYCLWSRIEERRGGERVILIDAMGQLPLFFAFSDLAIVAGSFSSRIGGHNVLEPCLYGVPVLFGPHMHAQTEFAERVLSMGAGLQVTASDIAATVQIYRENPLPMLQATRDLVQQSGSVLQTSWEHIQNILDKKEKSLGINHLS